MAPQCRASTALPVLGACLVVGVLFASNTQQISSSQTIPTRVVTLAKFAKSAPQASTITAPANLSAPMRKSAVPASTKSTIQSQMNAYCHPSEHTDYAGDGAPVWGMSFHLPTPGDCCEACAAHQKICGASGSAGKQWWSDPPMKCNRGPTCSLWVYCPEEQCFAFDIHKHIKGECWLKNQNDPTRPKDPHFGNKNFHPKMRASPRKTWPWAVAKDIWPGEMPQMVPWISGAIAPPDAVITWQEPGDKWRQRWCEKYGPCD